MNNLWIVCLVAIVFAAQTYQKYLKVKQEQKRDDPDLDASLAKIARLEERIQVLERIVTENKFDLGDEIDNLK